ncbi:hypothetical protein B0H13DRAFT_1867931 [Mycena leptocephala]|nr:hypothetical protein B0H13DRAFT_1867931 [Mycena leptocephala]
MAESHSLHRVPPMESTASSSHALLMHSLFSRLFEARRVRVLQRRRQWGVLRLHLYTKNGRNTPVVSSGLIDGDPFANLCVGAFRVRNARVALEPYLPAQESHFVPLPGYLSPIQDPPYTTPLAPNKICGENVATPPPHDDRYSDNWLTATNYCVGDATGHPETPLLDENPRFEIEEMLNLPVGHPQVPRFRESFVCDNVVFVSSLLPSEMERNVLPDYGWFNEESSDVDITTKKES